MAASRPHGAPPPLSYDTPPTPRSHFHAAPLALSGKDFRNGPGLRVRFTFLETEASNEESSFQVSVPGFFVSSALLLVEPPPLPQRIGDDNSDVLLDVSIDGGNSWSKQAASFRIKVSAVS
mgnify:CR=1 FL=1